MTRACSKRRDFRSNGRIATRAPTTERVATNIITPKGLDPFLSHGKMLEDGKADMYNACEWGNYCRVEETGKGSRQVGRRAIITYAAIVVGPKSSIYTPQQLADVAGRRAVLLWHPLRRAASAPGLPAARHGEALQRAVAVPTSACRRCWPARSRR